MKMPQTSPQARQSGNVMVYILLALVLIGALTVALTRQGDQGGDDLSYEQAELQASQLISYSLSAQNVVNQMIMSGSNIDTIDAMLPSNAAFNTAPNIHKVFHPQGGGLNYEVPKLPPFAASGVATTAGWYITKRNVQWTPSAATDLVLAAFSIDPAVCRQINKKLTGQATLYPLVGATQTTNYFTTAAATNLTAANCPSCDGKASLCVTDAAANARPTFYTILEGR